MSLRILFSSRPNFQKQVGGDSLHLLQTAEALRKLGHSVHIWDGKKVQKNEYDLIHHFNIGRPAAALHLTKTGLPMVISTIFVDYREHDQGSSRFRSILSDGLGPNTMEYLKLLARAISGREAWPPWSYLLHGHRASVQALIKYSSLLISASQAEAQLIRSFYPEAEAIQKLTLGLEHLKIQKSNQRRGVLSIARFEPLKNQLQLIKAIESLEVPLTLVGEVNAAHQNYWEACKKAAGPMVEFLGRATYKQCAEHYASAKVHVLTSHYESTGLVSLEALASGCQIVVNDHPIQRELFGEHAHYCRPNDAASIRKAITSALEDHRDHSTWAKEQFSWQKSAEKLDLLYRDIVSS